MFIQMHSKRLINIDSIISIEQIEEELINDEVYITLRLKLKNFDKYVVDKISYRYYSSFVENYKFLGDF